MKASPLATSLSRRCLLILAVLAGWASTGAPGATHRVALGLFSAAENTWEGLQAAEAVPQALQAALSSEPGIEWVERAQLGLVIRPGLLQHLHAIFRVGDRVPLRAAIIENNLQACDRMRAGASRDEHRPPR